MIDYDAMSDEQLSLEVGKLTIDGVCSYMIEDGKAIFNTRDGIDFVEFDINNWNDIGPIIEEHGINLRRTTGINGYSWRAIMFCISESHHDKNPKRAAAICFLKIMEGKK